jgi:hypothetical protein
MEPELDQYITADGARRWALAHEEAVRNGASRETIETLEALGFNLGLRRIEKVGEDVAYKPLRHEDIRSGLLPDDRAIVQTTGWRYGHRVIVRTKVY